MSRSAAAMTRREHIVKTLAERINAGELQHGERLGSEADIAAEFSVSRGTIRQALADLQHLDLIATRAGIGSFVIFDGQPLDAEVGWARALNEAGVEITTEILDITLTRAGLAPAVPALAGRDVIVLTRRRLLAGRPVSYERATVPAVGLLRDLPQTGLIEGSLTTTLRRAGVVAHHGTQEARVTPTEGDVASQLEREPGTLFLHTTRVSHSRTGGVVEHVESYLDPAHFSLHLTFGDDPA